MNLGHELNLFTTAVQFYTRLPVPSSLPYSHALLNQSRKYFTLIGLIVGLLASLVYLLLSPYLGNSGGVILSILSTILLTGAFHEDGFADSCDGLGGGWDKTQVLTIMKDSRLGTYGTIGLIGILGLKAALLMSITEQIEGWQIIATFTLAHTWSRQLASSTIEYFDYVQDTDISKVKPITQDKLSAKQQLFSIGIALTPVLLFSLPASHILLPILVSLFLVLLFMFYVRHRIGGYTGDILGACQQLSEVTVYLALLVVLSW